MHKLIVFSILLHCLFSSTNAQVIKLGQGRIKLVDLGAIIKSKPVLSQDNLVNVYTLSSFENEHSNNIVAIQALQPNGELDLSLNTSSGIQSFGVKLNKTQNNNKDLVLNPSKQKTKNFEQTHKLELGKTLIIKSQHYINRYLLSSRPKLVEVKQIVDFYDKDFLKTFALVAKAEGMTDIVVPTESKVYKFTLHIQKEVENDNQSHLLVLD